MSTSPTRTATSRIRTARGTDVVLVASSFWPREGGAERQLRQVLAAATTAGLRCAVITRALPDHPRRAEVDGIQVRRAGSAWLLSRAPGLGTAVCAVDQARHLLDLQPRTAVSIQLGAASVAVAFLRHVRGIRHVVRLTGGGTGSYRSEPWARRSSWLGRLTVRLVARRGVVIVSPARHLLADLAEAFPRTEATMRVIPNGVPDPGGIERADGSRYGVVWYARGGGVRSSPTFLRIAEACPDLTFVAIGRTDGLPASASVRPLGWVTEPYEVLNRSRVLLNTSPTEGMPNTALQALAAGLHVVGPPNRGLTELAEAYPGRVRLVDVDKPSAVAATLRAVHAAPLPGQAPVPRSAEVAEIWIQLFRGEARP